VVCFQVIKRDEVNQESERASEKLKRKKKKAHLTANHRVLLGNFFFSNDIQGISGR